MIVIETTMVVIHVFSLSVIRGMLHSIPGMDVPVNFPPLKANTTGKWEIACAQLCGLGHYRMRGQLFVHPKQDFDEWARKAAPENPATPAPNPVPTATPAQPTQPAS